MSGFIRPRAALCLVPVLAFALGSCKKRNEAAASDLKEAGYELTAEDWLRASREGDVQVMKKFVAGGFDPDTRDGAGNTALHEAAAAGAEEAADYLLARGLPVDPRNREERTPLMSAVVADRTQMVRWLLRQGADPRLKDKDGYLPLMLAAREDSEGSIGELAPYSRGDLDAALLLAALEGKTRAIDALTNYGASVYAKMEDGRTPLMLAAENGHQEAAELLVEIGSSRYATDAEGRTAADLANEAGYPEIALAISREVRSEELALRSPEELAAAMEEYVDAAAEEAAWTEDGEAVAALPEEVAAAPAGAVADMPAASGAEPRERRAAAPIEGAVIGRGRLSDADREVAVRGEEVGPGRAAGGSPAAAEGSESAPPLIMRHYRESEVPVEVRSVRGNTAVLRMLGPSPREVRVSEGETIPGSRLQVVRVQRRLETGKLSTDGPTEVSVVRVRDAATGTDREWISGVTSSAHDPVALVEDAETGRRYTAVPGQRFRAIDGTDYVVSDVRPNQIVIEEVATGVVETLPLRGPRG